MAQQRYFVAVNSMDFPAPVRAKFLAFGPVTKFGAKEIHDVDPLLDHSDPELRRAATTLLVFAAYPVQSTDFIEPLASRLTGRLTDRDPRVRWLAANGLGNLCYNPVTANDLVQKAVVPAVPRLAKLLTEPEIDLRIAAATALARLGTGAAAASAELAQAITRGDPDARIAAIQALTGLGPAKAQEALPQFIQVLEEREADAIVLVAVAKALGDIGPAAKSALPALVTLSNTHEDADVRLCAVEAIRAINR